MKTTLVIIFLVFLILESFCQPNNRPQLAVEKENANTKTTNLHFFKPNKLLKIKTKDGITYSSVQYSFSEKFIVINMHDTIPFDDIAWIHGKVYKDAERKVFGVIVTAIASPFIAFCILDTIVEGGPEIILAIPFIAMARGGIKLAGARKFHITPHCYIKVIEQKAP